MLQRTHSCHDFSEMALEPTRLLQLTFGVLSSGALIKIVWGFYVIIGLLMEPFRSF